MFNTGKTVSMAGETVAGVFSSTVGYIGLLQTMSCRDHGISGTSIQGRIPASPKASNKAGAGRSSQRERCLRVALHGNASSIFTDMSASHHAQSWLLSKQLQTFQLGIYNLRLQSESVGQPTRRGTCTLHLPSRKFEILLVHMTPYCACRLCML